MPYLAVLFSMILIPGQNLHGQDTKGKKGQPDVRIDVKREYDENGNISSYDSSYSFSWSYDGSTDMDSLLENLRKNYGISPFTEDEFFNMPFGNYPHFYELPEHSQALPKAGDDSLYEYINPHDSIYSFNKPYYFFDSPLFGSPFNDSIYYKFFHDPLFGRDPFNRDDFDFFRFSPSDSAFNFIHPFDMRSMLENHRRMMEELHQLFEFNMPRYPVIPDTIPQNPLQQRYYRHSKPIPKGQEI
jgi:hypothetical protein